jgi:hypothetical protein
LFGAEARISKPIDRSSFQRSRADLSFPFRTQAQASSALMSDLSEDIAPQVGTLQVFESKPLSVTWQNSFELNLKR